MQPAFLDRFLDPQTRMPRQRAFWIAVGALVALQLGALWLLCSHQVRKAEARQTQLQVQQLALADCLRYIPGSTIGSCAHQIARVDTTPTPEVPVASATAATASPVSYTIR
jgi:hypothetical protein